MILTFLLILLLTLVYLFGNYDFYIPTLIDYKTLNFTKFFPFYLQEFNNDSFNHIYNICFYIFFVLFIIEFMIFILFNKKLPKKRFYILRLLFFLTIILIKRLWLIFIICNTLFNNLPMIICYIIHAFISVFMTSYELTMFFLHFVSKNIYEDLSISELKKMELQYNREIKETKKELDDLLDKE